MRATRLLGRKWLEGLRSGSSAVIGGFRFQDTRVSLMAGIRWQPVRGVTASLALGLDVHQRFTLEDSRGHRRSEFESDPAPHLGQYVSSSF